MIAFTVSNQIVDFNGSIKTEIALKHAFAMDVLNVLHKSHARAKSRVAVAAIKIFHLHFDGDLAEFFQHIYCLLMEFDMRFHCLGVVRGKSTHWVRAFV